MKKFFISIFAFILLTLSTVVLAQSTNWADYGLDEEAVKFLSEEEKQQILNSKTPAQTEEYFRKGIQDGSIKPEEVPPPLLPLINKIQNENLVSLSDDVVSCFDYYEFNSIEVYIQSVTSNAVSGSDTTFFGDIKNNNNYPIVEGTLYVKIMKNIGIEKNPNGPDVVDQFVAIDNVTIPANGSIPFEFTWQVPAYATTGEYMAVTYFTSDKKFNLSGLSFTDDIIGNSFEFSVSGEQEEIITFDKSSVVINDRPYFFAAYPPRIQKGQPANINLDIINETETDENSKIKWKLYKWDSMHPNNLIREFTTDTQIKANEKTKIELSIPEEEEPVYLLVGELNYKDIKSIVNIRYVRDGVDKVRLNFPSVNSYPLVKGQDTTLFTCLHNSGQSAQVSNNKVILEIKDKKGKVVESYTYEGVVTGEMMAVKKDFKPKKALDKFTIHASIYTDGKLVDESVMEYDCELINPDNCIKEENKLFPTIIIGLIGIILLIFIFKKIIIKNNYIKPLIVLFFLSFSIIPYKTQALSLKRDLPTLYNTFYNIYNYDDTNIISGWVPGLVNPKITLRYRVEIKDKSTGRNLNYKDDSVYVGSELSLKFLPHKSTDIEWFGTGYVNDSPYGEWRNSSLPPPKDVYNQFVCDNKDYITGGSILNYYYNVYIPFVVSPPSKTISNLNNLSCGSLNGNENDGYTMDCKVVNNGTLTPKFNFGSSVGKFYYRYYAFNSYSVSNIPSYATSVGCHGSNIPMRPIVSFKEFSWSYKITAKEKTVANTPPTIGIDGPSEGIVETDYQFKFNGIDSGDKIQIYVDMNNDDVYETILPSNGTYNDTPYVGTKEKKWIEKGEKTIKAYAIDDEGVKSGIATKKITIYDKLSASCSISSPDSGYINPGDSVTFVVKPSGGKTPYTYSWYNGGTNISNTYSSISSVSGNNFEKLVTIGDNLLQSITTSCSIPFYSCGSSETKKFTTSQKPTQNLCSSNTAVTSGPNLNIDNSKWVWGCKNVDKQCSANVNEDLDKEYTDVNLKIQPKISPNCVVSFVGEKLKLSNTETCELTGPNFSQSYATGTDMSATSTSNLKAGLYTLKCEDSSNPDFIITNSDVCISNPTTIEK